jgi:UTP--glucose-1-phosphate uridylyltransferase
MPRQHDEASSKARQRFAVARPSHVINTNNLWVRLEAIDESWTDLPLIVNRKPVIPHEEDSPKVIQLESAMGAAIGTVKNAAAIEVGRDRFFPVKTTNDLFGVRSDLYELDARHVLRAVVEDTPPTSTWTRSTTG